MRIAVLGNADSWYFADLKRAAGDSHNIFAVPFSRLSSEIDNLASVTSGVVALNQCDAVLVRTMPAGSLEQVVFRMDALAQLESAGIQVLNPPRAIEVAVDKYLASARLQRAGLLVPRTFACQKADDAMHAFEQLGGDAVLKPIFGGEGRGIIRLSDAATARQTFSQHEQQGSVIYLQQFIPHAGADLRLLVIGDRVFGMRRVNPNDWRTNISLGAQAEPLKVTPDLVGVALRAAAAVGAPLAGIDLLPGTDGQLYALEVNAAPGWRALSQVTGVDVSREVLRLVTGI